MLRNSNSARMETYNSLHNGHHHILKPPKKENQTSKHVNRQKKTYIRYYRVIVSWFVSQIPIYIKLYLYSNQFYLWQKLQNTTNVKGLTFITFSTFKTICTFATISKKRITNFVIVTLFTASELTVSSIFSRTAS